MRRLGAFALITVMVAAGIGGSFATGMWGGGGGSAQGEWRNIDICSASHWPSETGGSSDPEILEFGSDECYYAINMDAGEYIQCSIPGMPAGYRNGSALEVRIYQASTSGTGENTWKVQGQALGDGDALSGTWGTAVSVVDTIAATNTMYISGISDPITIANSLARHDFLQLRIELDVENSTTTYFMGAQYRYVGD